MSETPSSKSQIRLMDLLGIEHDGSYSHAARSLEAQNLPTDGLPFGETWRTAGKLSDSELLAKLGNPVARTAAVATTKEVKAERHQAHREYIKSTERRSHENREMVFVSGGLQWENE